MKIRTESKRSAIIEKAAELFKETGYEGASMNELAKRLGGSKATLYGYFPSKEKLFSAVIRHSATSYLTEANRELRPNLESQAGLEAALTAFAEKMLSVLVHDTGAMDVYRMVIAEAGRSDTGQLFYESGPSETMAALAAWLNEAIDRGLLRKADPKLLALQVTALITAETSVRMYLRTPPPVARPAVKQMAKRAIEMFLAGAAPR